MNKHLYILFFLFLFSSCNNDVKLIGDEHSIETQILRKSYENKIKGEWIYKTDSSLSYIEQKYEFKENGILRGHILLMSRDSVFIKGKPELTDWKKIIDQDFSGHWSLLYNSSKKKNVLFFDARAQFGNTCYVDLLNVNDSILDIKSPLLISQRIKMHRKK